jgi:hypothetical protein
MVEGVEAEWFGGDVLGGARPDHVSLICFGGMG